MWSEAPEHLRQYIYPYCPDDEVREFLYGIRTEKKDLPDLRTSRKGHPIEVGCDTTQSALTQSVDKIFKCSWPAVFFGEAPLDLPASMEDFGANIACMRQEAVNSSAYEFYPIQIIQQSTNAPESAMAGMTQLRRALCTVFDAVHSEASPWKDVCNSLMESVWHDDLKGAHVSISFRPRWSLYPTTRSEPGEWPVIVPDVVFSAVVPISDNPRLLEARRYHPAYAFSDHSMEYKTLEIPILVVEYDKINFLQDDQPPRSETHREHLKAAIAAALPMHAVLGLGTPVYGVFIDMSTGESCAGSIAEVDGVIRPVIDRITFGHPGHLDFVDGPQLHVLHLQSIIANLGRSASSILDEIRRDSTLSKLKPNVCPVDESLKCAANRQVIHTQRPPLEHDETLQHLFSLNQVNVVHWLSEAEITLDNKTTLEFPPQIHDWMRLFAEPEGLPEAWIRKIVLDCHKGLSERARDLASEFLSKYRYASTSSTTPLPDSLKALLDYDVRASLTICLHASDLYESPANGLNPHSASSHWSMIYNSLFMRAIQKPQTPFVFSETYPRWNLHKNLRSFTESETWTPLLEEIRPSCAISYTLEGDHVMTRTFTSDRDDDVEDLGPELTVCRLGKPLFLIGEVHIPVMVGEYVLVPGDSDERAKHLAHLAMTMRSALALWEVHCLKGPIVGFLMERNIVETKLGWIDDGGKCVIRDASEYGFDLLDPCDTFRLHNFLRVFCSETFSNDLTEKVDIHATTAMQRLLDPSYETWREIV